MFHKPCVYINKDDIYGENSWNGKGVLKLKTGAQENNAGFFFSAITLAAPVQYSIKSYAEIGSKKTN